MSRSFRPTMEALEIRAVPATLVQLVNVATHVPPKVELTGTELVISGTAAGDSATVSEVAGGAIRVDVRAGMGPVKSYQFVAKDVGHITFNGGAGDDVFSNSTHIGSTANGDAGNDVLVGGWGIDLLVGGAGTDALSGGAGSDVIIADTADYVAPDSGDTLIVNATFASPIRVGTRTVVHV